MCDGVVIEGHILPELRNELVRGNGRIYDIVAWLIRNCGIAITPYIEAHWKTKVTSRDEYFWIWYTEQILSRSIRSVNPKRLDPAKLKRIHTEYRLPNDPFVRAYIECADSTSEPRYIFAEEMDLHDPIAKSKPTKTQLDIRERRSGSLCLYLEKELEIRVGSRSDFVVHFSIDQCACCNKMEGHPEECLHLPLPRR